MSARGTLLIGGAFGAVWAFGVVWIGVRGIDLPIFSLTPTLMIAFLGPGLTLAAMIFWRSLRRCLDPSGDDDRPAPSTRAQSATIEQTVLALCLWPAIGFLAADDGPGLLVALTLGFPFARLAYWAGLRAFGTAATFLATIFALLWSGAIWLI